MIIFGRDDSVSRLASSAASLTILTGDSGVGKTTVLTAAQEATRGETVVAPAPVAVRRAPGALQRALLEALALAVAEMSLDVTAAERVGAALKNAIERIVDDNIKGLAGAVGRHLLGIVRAHVGDAAADALGRIATELATPEDAALLARITNAADSDVVDLIGELAGETLRVSGCASLVLTVDGAENLGSDDLRRLADLATHLPGGCLLRAGLTTWDGETRAVADQLAEAGAHEIALSGLSVDETVEFLVRAELPPELAPVVHRVTNGYPLYIEDAVALLATNDANPAELSSLQPRDILARRTARSWRDLDAVTQTAAYLLAGYQAPLSQVAIPEYLGMSSAAWATIEARLRDVGIFTGPDRLWFHELRRRRIWSHILTDTQRAEAADRALPYLASDIASGNLIPERLVEYARFAPHSPTVRSDPKVAAVLAASREEIAVAAALMELFEPFPGTHSVSAEYCLFLAKDIFGATGDLQPALAALADRQLVVMASNDHAAVVLPFWGGTEAGVALAGRAAAELGRAPIPRAASQLFEAALRPRMGAFRRGINGIGTPSVAELSAMAEKAQQEQLNGSFVFGPRGPNLLLRARHGHLPVYASIAFDDAEARDEAFRQLSDFNERVFDIPLVCTTVRRHPLPVIPALRFVIAVGRALGRDLTPFSRGSRADLAAPIEIEEEALWRAEFVAAVRSMCSEDERLAYELEESFGLLFHQEGEGSVLVNVLGGEGARSLKRPPDLNSPYVRFQMSNDEGLTDVQRIARITWRSGHRTIQDPVVDELEALVHRGREFNRTQERAQLLLNEASLTEVLTRAADGQRADAQALSAIVAHGRDVPPVRGVSTVVLLQLNEPQPNLVAGAEAATMTVSAPNDLGRDDVSVRVVDVLPSWSDHEERLAYFGSIFGDGVDLAESTGWRLSRARGELARLAGHDESDVVFTYDASDRRGL